MLPTAEGSKLTLAAAWRHSARCAAARVAVRPLASVARPSSCSRLSSTMRRRSGVLAALLLLVAVARLPAASALFGWGDDEPETDLTRPVFSYSECGGSRAASAAGGGSSAAVRPRGPAVTPSCSCPLQNASGCPAHLPFLQRLFSDTVVVRTAYALQFLRANASALDAAGVAWDVIDLGGPANTKVSMVPGLPQWLATFPAVVNNQATKMSRRDGCKFRSSYLLAAHDGASAASRGGAGLLKQRHCDARWVLLCRGCRAQ